MKIRSGFVSNSSSSSFIITGKENIEKAKKLIQDMYYADYYELDDVLYTSMISDGDTENFNILYDMATDHVNGNSCPYDDENYYEFEGDLGCCSVYIEKCKCKDKFKAEQDIKEKLYTYVKNYIEYQEIDSVEVILNNDEVLEDAKYFLQNCCEIVGYRGE